MSRSFVRAGVLLALPVCAALVAGGTVVALSVPNRMSPNRQVGAITNASVLVVPDRYCYNWDFLNNTGLDANGLSIRLAGVVTYSAVYTGAMNPFGAPDPASGYDAGARAYTLIFSNGTALAGTPVQLGLCTDQTVLALDPGGATPPFTWFVDGQPQAAKPPFAGLAWRWLYRTRLQVQLTNDPQVSMTLMTLNLLDGGDKLSLDDLNEQVAAGLPLVGVLAQDPLPLGLGGSTTVDVAFDASTLPEPNHPYVLQAVLADDEDPGHVIHLYSQSLSPLATMYLPVIRRN